MKNLDCFVCHDVISVHDFLLGLGCVWSQSEASLRYLPYVIFYLERDVCYFMYSISPNDIGWLAGAVDFGSDVEAFKAHVSYAVSAV